MKRVSKHLFAVAMLLFLGATVCSANLVTYVTQVRNRERLIVMEEDGTNPVELLKGGRHTPAVEGPTVSPAGLEEPWILFNDHNDLYKIRPNGSEQTLVLCGGGTDKFGAPYYLHLLSGIWSPDGSEILFQPHESFDSFLGGAAVLALLPASHTAVQAETCTSELMRIYEPPSPWTVDAGPGAWNHDGSRIAFWETNMDTWQGRLAVIERGASGVWERIDTILIPDLADSYLWNLSWRPQEESGLLVFLMRGETAFWLASVDLSTREWAYVLDKGNRVQMSFDSYPKWSSNGDEILFTDAEGNLVRWIYPDGDRQVIGSGIRTDWQWDAVAGVCGDGKCAGSETQCNCALDCGAYPSTETDLCTDLADNDCDTYVDCDDSDCTFDPACIEPDCGDGACDPDETECSCPDDCGVAPFTETSCTDGVDNDCDGLADCVDPDCSEDATCIGGLPGDPCASGADCISGLCHPKKKVCK